MSRGVKELTSDSLGLGFVGFLFRAPTTTEEGHRVQSEGVRSLGPVERKLGTAVTHAGLRSRGNPRRGFSCPSPTSRETRSRQTR